MWNALVTFASVFSTVLLTFSYVPQVINLYRTKSTKGISMSFWYILDGSLILLFILALDSYFQTGDTGLVIAQFLNLVLALIVTSQVMYYKKQEEKEKEK